MTTTTRKTTSSAPFGWPVSFTMPTLSSSSKEAQQEDEDDDTLDFVGSADDDEDDGAAAAKTEDRQRMAGFQTLQPGPVLEACNRSDIQLARGASARPNLAKGKGRYLIFLPGILSFKTQADPNSAPGNVAATASANTDAPESESKPATVPKNTCNISSAGGTTDRHSANAGNGEATEPIPSKPAFDPKKHFVAKGLTMGTIEGITTDAPILKVPFPNGRKLVFKGKKIETSSKFMVLNCKASNSSVTCRDIFTSAIVFEEACWENGDDTTSSTGGGDVEQIDTPPFRHYGGSVRAMDGWTSRHGKKKAIERGSVIKTTKLEESSRHEESSDRDDDSEARMLGLQNEESEDTPHESKQPATRKRKLGNDSDYSEPEALAPVAKGTPRTSRARRASAEKARQRMEDTNDASECSEEETEEVVILDTDDDAEDSGNRKESGRKLRRVAAPLESDSDYSEPKTAARQGKRTTRTSTARRVRLEEKQDSSSFEDAVIVIDRDDDVFEEDTAPRENRMPRSSMARRGSAKRRLVLEDEQEDARAKEAVDLDADDEVEEDDLEYRDYSEGESEYEPKESRKSRKRSTRAR